MIMTNKNFIYLSVLTFSFLLFSCKKETVSGNGNIVTEKRSATNFYNVQVDANSKLTIRSGTQFSVEVKGYENLLAKLETKVENGTLKVQFEKGVNINNDNSEVNITMPSLVSVTSQGNGSVDISGNFIGSDIFSITKNGQGDVTVSNGSAQNFKLTQNGNSNFSGYGFSVENAIITMNGNGTAEVSVSKNLNVTINGNGNIFYKGDPLVTSNIMGNGTVVKK